MQNINSSEPKTKLNMNMQMRLLKMFVKHSWRHCDRKKFVLEFTNEIPDDTIEDDVRNIRGDIVIEKNPFSDFIDVKECQE